MTPKETALILRLHNAWRRDDDETAPNMTPPKLLGEAIDSAIVLIERGEELSEVFGLVINELDRKEGWNGNAPGHAHDVRGVWDSDNGNLAGKPCAWCAVWKKAKELYATTADAKGGA